MEFTFEEWKPVFGYEGYYEVSNLGRIKALARDVMKNNGVVQHRQEKIKTLSLDVDGYYVVGLNRDGVKHKFSVHRLVANAFVDGKFENAEVNHKDFNRKNNSADNLEWISHSDNIKTSYENDRHYDRITKMQGCGNPNYGNHVLKDKYKDKNIAIKKQSRPGVKNGRATPVTAYFEDGSVIHFNYILACAKYLSSIGKTGKMKVNSVAIKISQAAKSEETFLGIFFEI